ncbi:Gfo/Idh/MocA family oxidoreductase [Falsochrobactrum sp. TDYN1]|uniref:Gfo/Idh/MocA family oxidoreductase n=1 Tax=Falsochrobactrum tianjinense TaxID=2706015 RepID=A0A949UVH9_9HYPH|nr:Gfo/Idh/MocA family oxidoreductase [Falsochrobactrum sp. TDYN1]MBV2144073.1 Gfo/Idh/MocA family oxidoreductase [Falsochrobactrum sp. TDYN1]
MAPRIAVLGCGYWGGNHIRTLKSLGALQAVSDAIPENAQRFAVEFGVPNIPVEKLFTHPDIDGVVLALPAQFHARYATEAVRNGKDVLVEKPIALEVAEAEAEVKAALDNKRVFMVGHILRFHPAFEKLLDMVKSGELGDIRYVHSHRVGLGKFHTENDALWDLAPHDLSMILAIAGEEPSIVRGEGTAILDHLSDFAHLHMEFPNGIRGHLFASRLNAYRERRLSVVGSKGMAVFDDGEPWDRKLALYRHEVWREDDHWAFKSVDPDYIRVEEGMPLTRELQHFLHCIETRETPRTDGREAISVLRILTEGTVRHSK